MSATELHKGKFTSSEPPLIRRLTHYKVLETADIPTEPLMIGFFGSEEEKRIELERVAVYREELAKKNSEPQSGSKRRNEAEDESKSVSDCSQKRRATDPRPPTLPDLSTNQLHQLIHQRPNRSQLLSILSHQLPYHSLHLPLISHLNQHHHPLTQHPISPLHPQPQVH